MERTLHFCPPAVSRAILIASRMRSTGANFLLNALRALKSCEFFSLFKPKAPTPWHSQLLNSARRRQSGRQFSTTTPALGNWLEPKLDRTKRGQKGRPRVPTGGSVKGTTIVWGDWGLRMADYHRRISANHLKIAEDTIRVRLRGEKFRIYTRKCCNIGVYVSGNEVRMGKGKGSFDHWATRMAVNQILFEIKGRLHEQVALDALRLAGNKLPGQWKLVKRGEAPWVGITKLEGVTLEDLKRPRRQVVTTPMLQDFSPTSIVKAGTTCESQPRLERTVCVK